MESQRQPHDRWGKHIKAKQRAGAGQANTAEDEERLQETLYRLCKRRLPEPCCCGPRENQSRGVVVTQRQRQDQNSLLINEEIVHRESRNTIAWTRFKRTLQSPRCIASATLS